MKSKSLSKNKQNGKNHRFFLFDFYPFFPENSKGLSEKRRCVLINKLRKKLPVIGLALALVLLTLWAGSVVTPEQLQAFLSGLGSWAAPAYMGLFVLLPAFFFPVAVLALAGGLLFGLWWGSLYTFVGAVLNCTLMFFLARYAGREKIEILVRKKLSPQWQERLSGLAGKQGFALLIVLRLIPAVPYNLINYAFGLTAMPFRTYLAASAIGIIPGTLAFINIGDKALDPTSPGFWLAVGLLLLLLAVTAQLGKKLFPKENDHEENRP